MKFNCNNKKIFKIVCITLVLTVFFCVPVFAAEKKEWTIGYEENKNGPKEGKQGVNGWSFLYSDELNTDGVLDTSKLKECVWSDSGSCWLYYGIPAMWMPEAYAAKDYDCDKKGNWWRMDSNGVMDPNAGDDSVRSVVAWETPEDGTYKVKLKYTAGSNSYEWEGKTYYSEDSDGVTISVNTEKDTLEKVFCEAVTKKKPDLPTGKLSAEVELKKGERIYVSADPGNNGSCDAASIKMSIQQEKAEKKVAGEVIQNNGRFLLPGIAIVAVLFGFVFVLIRGKME